MVNISGTGASQIQQYFSRQVNDDTSQLPVNTDQKVRNTVMSGAELMERMGSVPKDDITFFNLTIKTRSSAYKEAAGELSKYHAMVDSFSKSGKANTTDGVNDLADQLRKVIDGAEKYIVKHGGDDAKADRRAVMGELLKMVKNELATLDRVASLGSTNPYNEAGGIDFKMGLKLAAAGVSDFTQLNLDLSDDEIATDYGNVGAGVTNTVKWVSYSGQDDEVKDKILKPLSNTRALASMNEAMVGIKANDLRTAARNIASSYVADALGFGDMIPKPHVVIHQDQVYLAMDKAEGQEFTGEAVRPPPPHIVQSLMEGKRYIEKGGTNELQIQSFEALKTNFRAFETSEGWMSKIDIAVDWPLSDDQRPDLSASMQKNLCNLQVIDILCGQNDRNVHNLFCKINGNEATITGIDNDCSFGSFSTIIEKSAPSTRFPSPPWGGPPLMSREAFEGLERLANNKPEFRETLLATGLNEKEVDATISRLDALHSKANEMQTQGRIVDDFVTWRSDNAQGQSVNASEFMMKSNESSYFERFSAMTESLRHQNLVVDPNPYFHDIN